MDGLNNFLYKPFIGDGNGYGTSNGKGYGKGYGDGNGNSYGTSNGYGNSYGYGNGYGYGEGKGKGNGYGYGDGYGEGYGEGYGSGSGSGKGIKIFNSQKVYTIDSIQTIIVSLRNNIAKGFILQNDLTLTPCYIVKQDNYFSHGETLKEAYTSLQEKLYQDHSLEERIAKFKEQFLDFKLSYKASELFIWHNILTGSCKMGRESFAKDKGINLEKDMFSIYEFIELTKNSYEGDNIKALLK